jgi:L-lactate dehydrogenase complex protein LldF
VRQRFLRRAREAMADPALQSALERNAARRVEGWQAALQSLPDAERLRSQAHEVRRHTIENLEGYLAHFISRLEQSGWRIHHATDASAACHIAIGIAAEQEPKTFAKAKSMVSEEIGLNRALERAGLRAVETDLGEYIVQLRGEPPSHIITPAVHLRREDIAATFADKLGMPFNADVEAMTAIARTTLRRVFLESEIGFTGVNFGVAESGTLCVVTNEGNGRMVSTVPPVHIALMGLERLVPTLDDLALMLQLLPRAATGQPISTYVSMIQGPREPGDPDGPEERHLILLDNGRIALSSGELREALLCIRCGACLNACPVFREIGGHAYGSVYPGPIGSVISPALFGSTYGHLSKASTLCGACQEACPVGIDLPKLLLRARAEYSRETPQPLLMRLAMKLYAWLMLSTKRYRAAQRLARFALQALPQEDGWRRSLPPPFSAWTRARHFPPFAKKPLRERFAAAAPSRRTGHSPQAAPPEEPPKAAPGPMDLAERFERELRAVDGELVHCSAADAPMLIARRMKQAGVERVLAWEAQDTLMKEAHAALAAEGIECLKLDLPREEGRLAALASLAEATAGLTGAAAGLADTGTVVLAHGPGKPALASLLPPLHLVLLRRERLHSGLRSWMAKDGQELVQEGSNIALVSGPSRTADIEMTLTLGVHGPGEVVVFLVN